MFWMGSLIALAGALSSSGFIKVVADMDEAIAHIREHGTQHSDAILTRTLRNANRFINEWTLPPST